MTIKAQLQHKWFFSKQGSKTSMKFLFYTKDTQVPLWSVATSIQHNMQRLQAVPKQGSHTQPLL